ncbi:spore coat protein SP96-like [Dreissena polymorpha]|nr:spore coat protein SP96-like [Dreissena polymorpha]
MTRLLLGVCFILIATTLLQTTFARRRGSRKNDEVKERRFSFKSREQKEFRNNKLPETLEYDIDIEGFPVTALELILNTKMNVPESEIGNERNGFRKVQSKRTKQVGIYTDKNGHGSFACEASKDNNWQLNCDLSGLVYFNNEACYIGGGVQQAECGNATTEGELLTFNPPDVVRSKRSVATQHVADLLTRDRRSILPSPGFKVVEIAFALDTAFMDQFYDRHPGNTAAAQAEAEVFMALLVNEMNVFYASVKEASAGALDLYVYPAAVVYPSFGSDFAWSSNHKSGTTLRSGTAFDADLRSFFSSGFTSRQHEHAMALTGLDLLGEDGSSGLLGYAYVGTVCVNTNYKYSINEYSASNVAWVASHELGHALGSDHDQTTACPAGVNVMSAYLFNPSATTADTYSKFSTCSASQFITHLNGRTDCTANNGFTDEQFRASFCRGLLGQRDNSLNYQCQQRTGYAASAVCSGTISGDAGCYAYGQVACRDASGACGVRLGFVWNGTPCGSGRMCFKGRCVANFEVCDSATTAAPTTAAPTTAASTTAAPTTAAPTTAAPTTAAPTTAAPTTAAPTTTASTTAAPTTAATTTSAPTTAAPTTATHTTAAPTTAAPTTAAPTTATPTTARPTTAAPTTARPTTAAPTTAAPTTAAPTTTRPTTAAPTTTRPTTAAPTTAAPCSCCLSGGRYSVTCCNRNLIYFRRVCRCCSYTSRFEEQPFSQFKEDSSS